MRNLQAIAYILIIVVFGVLLMKEGAFILVPLVWGVFFAFALNPMAVWFEKKAIPRGMSIALSILLMSLVVLGVFYLLLNQMIGLIREIPEIGENLQQKIERYSDQISLILGEGFSDSNHKSEFWSILKPENFNQTLFTTGKSLTFAGIIPLYIFLLLYYKDFFVEFLVILLLC